ncbi:MAG: alkyl hydroperoxide reductase subunit F [Erysipelothrix sp.]|nr:alkyl hydroperoxide reductase subunit F [Erysipelothrix sp.]
MKLNSELQKQFTGYMDLLKDDIILTASLDDSENSKKVKDFLDDISSISEKIVIKEASLSRTPSFRIDTKAKVGNIVFAAVPLGHEFASFVLALLQSSGVVPKISEESKKRIQEIDQAYHFETYISLSCHICPDVVQALNIMAVLNDNITHTTIDGALFKDEIDDLNIMAVPTVMLNGREFMAGRTSIEEILDKIVGEKQTTISYSKPFDVMVIGGGPAGSSSAIYAARKGLSVIMVADKVGGQVLDTLSIENLIGTVYTEGPKLAQALNTHMQEYNIEIVKNQTVSKLEKDELINATLNNGDEITAKSVIIATGARWRNANVPGEKEFKNKGVAYCPHCDGPLFENKDIAVIGGGNSGIEAAIDLSNTSSKVTVLEFMPELKADAVLQKKMEQRKNINVILNAQTTEISGDSRVSGLSYKDRETNQIHDIKLAGVFVQIGLAPNTEWLGDYLAKSPMGEIIVDQKGETSIKGIYAAGDCTNSSYKQIVIAMGSGATAALSVADYLMKNFDK